MQQIAKTKEWFEKAIPAPTDKNFSVQVGVHFEEVSECVLALAAITEKGNKLLVAAHKAIHELAENMKAHSGDIVLLPDDRAEFLDALVDQLVTATGSAYMANMDIVGALEEVNRSNFSKFEYGKPVFNEQGKIKKGANYTPPNLAPFT